MTTEIRALSHRSTNDQVFALVTGDDLLGRRVLDVGAGEGYFSERLGQHIRARYGIPPGDVLRACDRFPALFRYPDVPCDPIDATGVLPYRDGSFDTVVAVEVVEHVEDHFRFIRELHRVVAPGGRVLVTTPNLLNVNSRLRYLHSGFWLLFDPLPLGSEDIIHTAGHINPITFYYLGYTFHRAGFSAVRLHFDRHKRSAALLAALAAPFILLGNALFRWRLRRRAPERYRENAELLRGNNSWGMLTSRSVIVEGIK
ncbi:MAG: methyltransferase domain-containing protein [Gemmatimonadales bacterium]|nr:methyltransferase domain-containing protein [Gemmatimonadales bacterium]